VKGDKVTTARYGATRTPGQLFALAFGAVYVLIGILGFITPLVPGGKLLGIFGINPLHNIIHLAIGALFVLGSTSAAMAKTINLIVGVVYLLVGVLGLFSVVVPGLIANNGPDTALHLATGALAVYFGTAGAKARSTATA
jgi:uncharacterized protein DUF4383